MPRFTRYTCKPELLPTVEAVLAAHGHTIATPSQHAPNGTSAVVMTCGETFVLLAQTAADDRAEIEVWGPAQTATIQVLEAAPIELEKQACDVPVRPRERELGGSDDLWNETQST
jgi:hypothetical protein